MNEATITLLEPIKFGSEIISTLTIRKPKAKDLRMMPTEPKMGDMLDLLAALCGHPSSLIGELSMEDLGAATEALGQFMGKSLPIGAMH